MSVAIVKTKPSYNNVEDIKTAMQRAFDLIEYTPKKDKLILKPNVASSHGKIKKGDYVPAAFCAAIAEIYKDREVVVAEGAACGMDYEGGMENHGYYKLRDKYENVSLCNLKEDNDRVELDWKYGKMKVPRLILDNEYINIAKFKTHYFTNISMCMKNQKGVLPDALKKKFHHIDLQDMIYELSQTLIPDLNILDGLIGLDGNGPGSLRPINGRTQKMGVILAGRDICEVDHVAVKVTKFDRKITHVPDVPTEILGETDFSWPFKAPDLGQQFEMMNFKMQLKQACSGCMESFLDCATLMMKKNMNPFSIKNMKANMDFFKYGIINPLILYIGPNCYVMDDTDIEKSKNVCVGVCAKDLAEKHGFPYIPGCPPTAEEFLNYTLPKKELEENFKVK